MAVQSEAVLRDTPRWLPIWGGQGQLCGPFILIALDTSASQALMSVTPYPVPWPGPLWEAWPLYDEPVIGHCDGFEQLLTQHCFPRLSLPNNPVRETDIPWTSSSRDIPSIPAGSSRAGDQPQVWDFLVVG